MFIFSPYFTSSPPPPFFFFWVQCHKVWDIPLVSRGPLSWLCPFLSCPMLVGQHGKQRSWWCVITAQQQLRLVCYQQCYQNSPSCQQMRKAQSAARFMDSCLLIQGSMLHSAEHPCLQVRRHSASCEIKNLQRESSQQSVFMPAKHLACWICTWICISQVTGAQVSEFSLGDFRNNDQL